MDNKGKLDRKLPYEKPALRTIEFAAEEVLVNKCKKGGAPAPMGLSGCGVSGCATIGGS